MTKINEDFTHKPDDSSLESREGMGSPTFGGKTKSVWQEFVDSSGFKKRHAKMLIKQNKKKRR